MASRSKRRRRHRRRATAPTRKPKRRQWKRKALVAGILVACCLLGIWLYSQTARKEPPAVSNLPDLADVEPQVASKLRRLRRELVSDPLSSEKWGRLGMNLDVHGFRSDSIPCFSQAAAIDPSDSRWPYYAAAALTDSDPQRALTWIERCLKLRPLDAPLLIQKGRALLDLDRLDDAKRAFEQAVRVAPDQPHAYFYLARVAVAGNMADEAKRNLDEAIRLDPKFGNTHGLKSEILRREGRVEAAAKEMQAARRNPEPPPLRTVEWQAWAIQGVSSYWFRKRGESLLDQGDNRGALRELDQALRIRPSAKIEHSIGVAMQGLQRLDEAIEHYRRALAMDPLLVRTMNNLAACLLRKGGAAEAKGYLLQALKLDPDVKGTYDNLATVHLAIGEPKQAIRDLRTGLTKGKDDPMLALQLALLLATAEDPGLRDGKEAARLARGVIEQEAKPTAESYVVLAAALAETGDYQQASKTARRALSLAKGRGRSALRDRIRRSIATYEQARTEHGRAASQSESKR